jgi:hypothetical protein
MSAYKDALTIDAQSSEQRLALAADVPDRCEGVVMLDGVVALRPTPDAILCEVLTHYQLHIAARRSTNFFLRARFMV